nr:MAG TPA: hypothetical protein [Caudoviricetes sp.]
MSTICFIVPVSVPMLSLTTRLRVSHGIIDNKRVRAPFITTAYFIPI